MRSQSGTATHLQQTKRDASQHGSSSVIAVISGGDSICQPRPGGRPIPASQPQAERSAHAQHGRAPGGRADRRTDRQPDGHNACNHAGDVPFEFAAGALTVRTRDGVAGAARCFREPRRRGCVETNNTSRRGIACAPHLSDQRRGEVSTSSDGQGAQAAKPRRGAGTNRLSQATRWPASATWRSADQPPARGQPVSREAEWSTEAGA